jgi:hypothetical protein
MFSEASAGDGAMSVVRYLQRSVIAATILMYALPAFAIEQSGLMGRHSMPHRPPENRFLWKLPLRGVRHARPKNQSARNWERRKKGFFGRRVHNRLRLEEGPSSEI